MQAQGASSLWRVCTLLAGAAQRQLQLQRHVEYQTRAAAAAELCALCADACTPDALLLPLCARCLGHLL